MPNPENPEQIPFCCTHAKDDSSFVNVRFLADSGR